MSTEIHSGEDNGEDNGVSEDELAAYESMYGREDRELQLSRHGDECDCDDCEAARLYLRNMQL